MHDQPLSSRTLDAMPDPASLWQRSVALAALERCLSPEWEERYYSFDSAWAPGEHVASMRNGSGDDYFIGFSAQGVFLKGFDHEAVMSPYREDPPRLWEGMYHACPESLVSFRDEPAFAPESVTFALWWTASAACWRRGVATFPSGRDPDGSERLLRHLGGGPERYVEFATEYYEVDLSLDAVRHVYAFRPLTPEVLRGLLQSGEDSMAAAAEIASMGYGKPFPF